MLQQTQVDNVIPYYERFVRRFPDLKTLARAGEHEVLRYWSGLGYYSRARNLLQAAKVMMHQHGGKVPKDYDALIQLSGIGPYTAGAILSIAYDLPFPILDGNVRRVLSRIFLNRSDTELWKISGEIVSHSCENGIFPSNFNQSLMELGALVCLPQNPSCGLCPLRNFCQAKKRNLQEKYPVALKSPKTLDRTFALAMLTQEKSSAGKHWLLRRRADDQRWLKGMWEFPMVELKKEPLQNISTWALKNLSDRLSKDIRCKICLEKYAGTFQHSITYHRLKIFVFCGTVSGPTRLNQENCRWFRRGQLNQISSSSMLQKALRCAAEAV